MSNLPALQEIEIMEKVFELEQRKAKAMIQSQILPQNFRNIGDVIVLNEMSRNLQIPVILLAQQLYIVHGKVGFSGQFAIALLNKTVEFGKLDKWNYEKREDGAIRVVGERKGEKLEGAWIDKELVKRNGWDRPKGNMESMWVTNFDLMAHYRAATWFLRLYFPEMLMGMHTEDEIRDEEATVTNTNINDVKISEIEAQTIDPLELTAQKQEEVKVAEVMKEPEKVTVDTFKELYKNLNKEQKVNYAAYTQGVDLSKLSEEELANFYKEVKAYVGA